MEKMKQECKVKKPLKIWQGVLTLLVSAVILFVAAPILLSPFGMYGSLLGELLLFGVAVGAVLLFQGDLREAFPLKKPHFSGIAGTILIWVETFLCEMVCFSPSRFWRSMMGCHRPLPQVRFCYPLLQ